MSVSIYYARDSHGDGRLVWSLVAALLLHAALLPAGARLWPAAENRVLPSASLEGPLEVIAVTEAELDTEQTRQQFVSLTPPEVEERPAQADFADQYERTVDQQTVNRTDSLASQASLQRQSQNTATNPQPAAVARAATDRIPPPAPAVSPAPRTEPQTVESEDPGAAPGESETSRDAPLRGDERAGSEQLLPPAPLSLSAFMPNQQTAGTIADSGSRRNDHLELPEGERTQLNSYRSMYWSFFNRLHDALAQEWDPNTVYARHDPTFELYGRRDRYAVLDVTLNGDGSLRHAVVQRSSGLDFYDDECVRAFRAAAPFPNVPEGLKDHNGHVTFQFGFLLNLTTRESRIRRLGAY